MIIAPDMMRMLKAKNNWKLRMIVTQIGMGDMQRPSLLKGKPVMACTPYCTVFIVAFVETVYLPLCE